MKAGSLREEGKNGEKPETESTKSPLMNSWVNLIVGILTKEAELPLKSLPMAAVSSALLCLFVWKRMRIVVFVSCMGGLIYAILLGG